MRRSRKRSDRGVDVGLSKVVDLLEAAAALELVGLDLVGDEKHLLDHRHARPCRRVTVDAGDDLLVVEVEVVGKHARRNRTVDEDRRGQLDRVRVDVVTLREV